MSEVPKELSELSEWSQGKIEGYYSGFVLMKPPEESKVYHLPIEDKDVGINTLCMQNRILEKDLRRYHVQRVNLKHRRVCKRCLKKKRKMINAVRNPVRVVKIPGWMVKE